jgi:hypothetical protein
MIRRDGRWWMFFEALVKRGGAGKGEIGMAASTDGHQWAHEGLVLAEPFHLSYPYVFEWDGECYMVPESYQADSVRLYRASPFPTRWVFVSTLLEGPFVDPSLFRHDGRWWMFVETNPLRTHDTLRLFHAENLHGPWNEHPVSPVVERDPRSARPAGRVVTFEDRLLRYAQDCRPRYGTRVRCFEITDLTTGTYREREVAESPVLAGSGIGWNSSGMHHLDPHPMPDGTWIACVDGWTLGQG